MGRGDGSPLPFGNHSLAQPLASMLLIVSGNSVDHVLLITSKARFPSAPRSYLAM